MTRNCLSCGVAFEVNLKHGKKQRYCGPTCRKRAQRQRIQRFLDDVKHETETPAPIRSLDELGDLIHAEAEMIGHYAQIVDASIESTVADVELIVEAEETGRSAWRYMTPEEEEVQSALKALRAFDPGVVWCAWEE